MLANLLKKIPPSFLLFLFFLSVYLFTMSGVIQYGDEAEKYLVAQSIVERHDFSFHPTVMRNEVGVNGRSYSVYELGTSLLQVPFYAVGRWFFNFFPTPDPNWITMLFVGLLNPLLTALACVLFFKTILQLGSSSRTAIALTLTLGLATITFPYAKGYNREPILTVLLLLLFFSAIAFEQTRARRWLVANGLAAGALVFTKLIEAAVLPIFLAYLITVIVQERNTNSHRSLFRDTVKVIGIFLTPIIISLAIQAIYSYARFGTIYGGLGGTQLNPLEVIASLMPLGNPAQMSIRMLLSTDKSVFLYSPPILLFLVAWFNWFRAKRKEAFLILGLIVIAFLAAVPRPDGDTPSWWGPRYLVQVTPFFLFPISALLESSNAIVSRLWAAALAILSVIGVIIQSIGVFTNSRDELDITTIGPTLASQWEFLRHRAVDSLLIHLSPIGSPIQINPFGLVLITIVVLCGILIFIQFRFEKGAHVGSPLHGIAALVLILAVELAGLTFWVVAPYSRVLAAQANTKYVAANRFLADKQLCKANAMYLLALRGDTDYKKDSALRVNQAFGFQDASILSSDSLMQDVEVENGARVEEDTSITWTGNGSVKISAPLDQDVTVTALSRSLTVRPSASYQLSGWDKLLNVYGTGYAFVSIYEDDGNFTRSRTTDIISTYQTSGWQPFSGTITTLPTTRRFIIKTGLWRTFGALWVDDVRLKQMDSQTSAPTNAVTPCKIDE